MLFVDCGVDIVMLKEIGGCNRPRILKFFHISQTYITLQILICCNLVPEINLGGQLSVKCRLVELIDLGGLSLEYALPTQHALLERRNSLILRGFYLLFLTLSISF